MVGTGSSDSFINGNKFEIVDLENPVSTCKPIPNYPFEIEGAMAGLGFDEKPIVCGGHNGSERSECYMLDLSWQSLPSMSQTNVYAQLSPSPFANKSHHLVLNGGMTDETYSSNVLVLTQEKWESLPSLPNAFYGHCTLLINSSTLMTIGGYNDSYIADTYYFHSLSLVQNWVSGPSLQTARYWHACGRIRFILVQFYFSLMTLM